MARCPWYITPTAVEMYADICRYPDDDEHWERAEQELIDIAIETVASGRIPVTTAAGHLRFRGPKPRRLRLIVSTARRPEGNLPQLIAVLPTHDRAPKPTR